MTRSLLCSALGGAMLIPACGPTYLTFDDAARLRIGAPRQQVLQSLPLRPSEQYQLHESDLHIDAYPLHLVTVVSITWVRTGPNAAFTPHAKEHPEKFLLLYKADTLRYWGTATDFARSEDSAITSIAPDIHRRLFPGKD